MKKSETNKLYDVVHYASSKLTAAKLETIAYNVPIALAKWFKRTKGNTTHRAGEIRLNLNK